MRWPALAQFLAQIARRMPAVRGFLEFALDPRDLALERLQLLHGAAQPPGQCRGVPER